MPGCPPFTLTGVTPEVWSSLTAKAQGAAIPITGDSGTARSQGVTVDYERDPGANTVTVTVIDMPGWTDCATVQAVLREVVRSCSGA
jgi:hypothetical protein